MNNPAITFYGGVGTVTGANFLFEIPDGEKVFRVLVDCGLFQGSREASLKNHEPFPYTPSDIDVLVVTHAHMDHIGRIGKLVKDGFTGSIYSTGITKEISVLMLADAIKIMGFKERDEGREPLYRQEHIDQAFKNWKTLNYHEEEKLGEDFSFQYKNAGHILGSAMAEFSVGKKKVVFTGDIGNDTTPLLKNTESIKGADYVVMESVYGDRNHPSEEDRDGKFKEILKNTIERGGVCIIPAFSLERTQVILKKLNDLIEGKEIPSVPVFLDSPLAIRVTNVYERMVTEYKQEVQDQIRAGDDIFDFPRYKETARRWQSEKIAKTPAPKIIIAGSGMSTGGRVLGHEAKYLGDAKNTLLLVGYQSTGTLGREIQEGNKRVVINEKQVSIRAQVESIGGYSSHKDSEGLLNFIADTKGTVKKVFVVMGEPKSGLFLAQRLHDYLGVDALYPKEGA